MNNTYQKIPGPFNRDPKTNKIIHESWTSPELEATQGVPWLFTEKVDGTNIRVVWDGYNVSFFGRTDNAQIPPDLLRYLEETFGGEDKSNLFEQQFGSDAVTLYGEGYGPKINGGGKYRKDTSFVLFDVKIGGMYLLRDSIEDIARNLNIEAVPIVLGGDGDYADLWDGIATVSEGLQSLWGDFPAEGLVGVTKAGLLSRRGDRIIVKIKSRDFLNVQPMD
jgi:hypothetical protein